MTAALRAALGRHQFLSLLALAVLVVMAWAWLLSGGGMSGSPEFAAPVDQSSAGMNGMAMPSPAQMSPPPFVLVFTMWWVMMVAMMLPSAAPTVLLYGRTASRSPAPVQARTGWFLAGYLLAWGGFSLAAAVLQLLLDHFRLLAPMAMQLDSRVATGAVLVCAGIYQISPLKTMCLRHCRSPAQFLVRHYRPGRRGALTMGLIHGAYCVGCCWLLMALLFAGGVMNLAWIAALTLAVAADKLLPFGRVLSLVAGLAFIGFGVWIAMS